MNERSIYNALRQDPLFEENKLEDWLYLTPPGPGNLLDFARLIMDVAYRSPDITKEEGDGIAALSIEVAKLANHIFARSLPEALAYLREREE